MLWHARIIVNIPIRVGTSHRHLRAFSAGGGHDLARNFNLFSLLKVTHA
jgi:hypothetical protein